MQSMFRLGKELQIGGNEVEGERCVRGSNEKLWKKAKSGWIIWKKMIEIIMWKEMR